MQPVSYSQLWFQARYYAAESSLSHIVNSFFKYLEESFYEIPKTINRLVNWISPSDEIEENQLSLLPLETPSHLNEEETEKFLYISRKIEEMMRDFGLSISIEYTEDHSSPWTDGKSLGFGRDFLQADECEIDFGLAHEFSHIKLHHIETKKQFYEVLAVVELIALVVFFPLIIPIDIVAFFLSSSLSKTIEQQADLHAIRYLGTADGAMRYFLKSIIREGDRFLETVNVEDLTLDQKNEIAMVVSNQLGFSHPNAIERFHYCQC